MKYFAVNMETLRGMWSNAGEVDSDGEVINSNPADDLAEREIIVGYTVHETDEDDNIIGGRFYPVKTDFRHWLAEDNDEVLEQIKKDHPADEWQNNSW